MDLKILSNFYYPVWVCRVLCFIFFANERYRNTVKDLLLPNTVSQKDEKPHTEASARSYRNNAHLK